TTNAIGTASPPNVTVPSSDAPVSGSRASYELHPATNQLTATTNNHRILGSVGQTRVIPETETHHSSADTLFQRDRLVSRGGDRGAPGGNRDIRTDIADAAVAHYGLHGVRSIEGIDRVEILLAAHESPLGRMEILG